MTATLQNLGLGTQITADKLSYGAPDWTVTQSATATALSVGPAAKTGAQHYLCHARISYSAAPAAGIITVKDGSTVIWQEEVGPHLTEVVDLDFEQRPLRATVGAALTINVESAGGSIVQSVSASGFSDSVQTQVSV